jgi:adenylate cyclase
VKGQQRHTSAAELTGELPRFVRDAVGRPVPVDEVDTLDEEDEATAMALVDLGLDEEEAREAVRAGRVPLVLAQQVVGEKPRYDLDQVSRRSGVPASLLREIRVASGLPIPEKFTRADLAWAKKLNKLLEVLPAETVVRSARARGTSLAMIVRSDLSSLRDELILPLRQAGADDLTVAVALAETAKNLDDLARELLTITYGLHLEHQLGSEVSATMTRSGATEVDLAVGFVDLVGWTSLSSRVDPEGLDSVLDAFEARVVDVVVPESEVGVVKYLGDAVMLVGPDVPTLAKVMLDLAEPADELEDAPLRGGLAAGAVRIREGDYFGAPVNLAARLTDLARPWSVLAAEEVSDELDAHFETKRIRPVRIRGVGLRRPLSVRSRDEAA